MQFDYEIKYKKGKENVTVDALFRCYYRELQSLTSVLVPDEFLARIEVKWQENSSLKAIIVAN